MKNWIKRAINVIDRVYKLKNQTEVMREKMNVANHRIDNLEYNQN
jgi:hypothetical protein